MMPSVNEMEAYIRQAAVARGIDPEIAVRVARSEGLGEGIWQSNVKLDYGRERSYGPFQLHVAPEGRSPGMGNEFKAKTGLDPSDPSTWRQGVDFALTQAKEGGWGPWFGAKKIGITGMEGIGGNPYSFESSGPSGAGTSMGGYAEGPAAVQARMDQEGLLGGSTSPSQEAGMDFNQIGKAGKAFSKLAAYGEEEPLPLPTPLPALMPLRRITLGQGLLG